ncbi:MAG TPA: efflux RND transporter periplasmic adaptor subunit [Vicinamibacterales bacterium]|nr:efflux RND transporter periplasmic adaptor subunit [Vicinamibacterales bacterium]
MSRHRPLLAAIAVSCAALVACSDGKRVAAAEQDARTVKTALAQVRDVRREVEVIGTLAAREEVVVSSEVAGRVAKLAHDLGDKVSEGTPLVELDPEKARYRADTQRAALAQARAKYGAPADGDLPPLDQVPEVVSSAAQLAEATQQLDRAKSLAARKLVAQSDLDAAQTRYDTAKAAHDQALASARQLRADIEAQSSSLQLAERELRDTVIRAPFEGYVAERLVALGQFVQPQTPIMRIVRLQPLKLTAEVPEKFAPWIETGRPIVVHVDAYPDQPFDGKVVRISPSVNLKSRAFAIEGEVPNPEGRLKPGTFARVQIATDHVDRAVTIPASAVQSRYGTNRVFVVESGKLSGREVILGDRLGDQVEVSKGLDAGTPLVAGDVEQLADGMKVSTR